MVKITGPLHSQAAGGSIGDSVTFSQTKGRAYARKKVNTPNPNTAEQRGSRALFGWLPKQWSSLTFPQKASWTPPYTEPLASNYTNFLKHNIERWTNFKSPGKAYPVAEVNRGSNRSLTNADWQEHRIKLRTFAWIYSQQWTYLIFASLSTGFTPHPDNAILVVTDLPTMTLTWWWTPPERTTWYFRTITCSDDGHMEPPTLEKSATPP